MRIGRLLGPTLILFAFFGCISGLPRFFYLPSLIIVLFISIGLGIMTYGGRDLFSALRSIRILFYTSKTKDCSLKNKKIIQNLITYVYVSGVLGITIDILYFFDYLKVDPEAIPSAFAFSILTLFYAFLISELILRPVVKRIDYFIFLDQADSEDLYLNDAAEEEKTVITRQRKILIFFLSIIVLFLCFFLFLFGVKEVSYHQMRSQLQQGLNAIPIDKMTGEVEAILEQVPKQDLTNEVDN